MKIDYFNLKESYSDLDEVLDNGLDIGDDLIEACDAFIKMESFQGPTA